MHSFQEVTENSPLRPYGGYTAERISLESYGGVLWLRAQQVPSALSYTVGLFDGYAIANFTRADAGTRALEHFATVISNEQGGTSVHAIAFGIQSSGLAAIVILEDIDVEFTRYLFKFKEDLEEYYSASFELQVKASQGRLIAELIPEDFVFWQPTATT